MSPILVLLIDGASVRVIAQLALLEAIESSVNAKIMLHIQGQELDPQNHPPIFHNEPRITFFGNIFYSFSVVWYALYFLIFFPKGHLILKLFQSMIFLLLGNFFNLFAIDVIPPNSLEEWLSDRPWY